MSIIGRTRLLPICLALVAIALVAAVGCRGDNNGAGGDKKTGSSVAVTLKEFEILTDKDSVPAGTVTFRAKNTGPDDLHELVVVKSDLPPGGLPASSDGVADEEGTGVQLIGEIAEFAVGGEEEVSFDLKPGKYVLLCNLVEEAQGVTESHYKSGMYTAFTVE